MLLELIGPILEDNSFQNYVFSRNHLNNSSVKYKDNNEVPENLLQNYVSEEIEKINSGLKIPLEKMGGKLTLGLELNM